jgi:hypothetical protein
MHTLGVSRRSARGRTPSCADYGEYDWWMLRRRVYATKRCVYDEQVCILVCMLRRGVHTTTSLDSAKPLRPLQGGVAGNPKPWHLKPKP